MTAVTSHAIGSLLRRSRTSPVRVRFATAERVVSVPHNMMGNALTVTEKEHWKNRIAERIEKRIDALFADQPGFLERIRGEALKHALDSLGIRTFQERLDAIDKQEERLDARKDRTRREMLARIRDVPIQQVSDYRYGVDAEVELAVEKRQALHEEELLAETELGRQILSLRIEKDNLLDTVWLADGTQVGVVCLI